MSAGLWTTGEVDERGKKGCDQGSTKMTGRKNCLPTAVYAEDLENMATQL
jgi:hypothetical protein